MNRAESDEATERSRRRTAAILGADPGAVRDESLTSADVRPVQGGLPRHYRGPLVEIVAVAAEAVHSVHEAGFVHRDIKPSNIFVEYVERPGAARAKKLAWHPWLLDFGLARRLIHEPADGFRSDREDEAPSEPEERLGRSLALLNEFSRFSAWWGANNPSRKVGSKASGGRQPPVFAERRTPGQGADASNFTTS